MKVTDFIYAVISEEMGFVFSTLVVVLFVLLIIRAFYIAKTAKDMEGSLIVAGVATMYLAHFLENVGMNIGLMPITRYTTTFYKLRWKFDANKFYRPWLNFKR